MTQTVSMGFPPFYKKTCKILVLGSFPSVKSREISFYYGNPQNRFWKVAAKAFGCSVPETVEEKKVFLAENGVALWDVVAECEIKGSMDSDIKNYSVADVRSLVAEIRPEKILLNGKKAAEIFAKNFPELVPLSVVLPSTSPANVRFDESLWLKEFIRP